MELVSDNLELTMALVKGTPREGAATIRAKNAMCQYWRTACVGNPILPGFRISLNRHVLLRLNVRNKKVSASQ